MSSDRFITWPDDSDEDLPNADVIGEVLRDFLYGIIQDMRWEACDQHFEGIWFVRLKGSYSHMFRRHGGVGLRGDMKNEERWIEVWVKSGGLTITTRRQDDLTNCLADEFARRCTRRWGGELEAEGL